MKTDTKYALLLLAGVATLSANARNPIIQTAYTADPAPMVHQDKVFLYTSHDQPGSTWFTMDDWRLYTSGDMVNWTDHGIVLKYTDFEWAKGDAWAAQCVERDGKFYMYVPVTSGLNGRPAIGVAVADSPYGPFHDPLGKPLVQGEWGDIDPTVFIDDDGQAYMYWGNPDLLYVRLNPDMISYRGDVVRVPMTEASFAKREDDPKRATRYEEAPWLYKRSKLYYLFWAGGPLPEHLAYSTSESPAGPWRYGGVVMPEQGGSFTNHPGVIDFRGKTYLFYHDAGLPGGSGFTRSVCVDELKFNPDGTIRQMKMTDGPAKGLAAVNPYRKNEAETIAWSEGFKSSQNDKVGVFVTASRDGSYTSVLGVDFGEKGARRLTARMGTTHNSPITLEVRTGGPSGELIATLKVPRTGGDNRWELVSVDIPPLRGVHDLCFVVRGKAPGHLMYFDYWMFSE